MALIALVRHGETDYNKQFIIQGHRDIPLNDLGKSQALQTAQHFKDIHFDLIITSPLIRARETAEIIANEIPHHPEVIIDHTFIERNFGEADGKNVGLYIDLVHQKKVQGLESEEDIKRRMYEGIKNATQLYKNKNIIIVCHSHSIKAALAAIDPKTYDFKVILKNCSISLLESKDERLEIIKVNYNDYI